MEKMRINKYLASRGVCSRREADRLVEAGKVLIDGITAEVGAAVTGAEKITVNGILVASKRPETVVIAFYKPVGVTVTEKDPHAEKVVSEFIDFPERVTYAGRLDKESEGLLLLTNDGDLIDGMMRGRNGHEKEYEVRIGRPVTDGFLRKMQDGVYLKDLDVTTRPCVAKQTGKNTFSLILTQGLNRQIRRMCKACGAEVKSLKRIRVLNITLGDLKPGEWRVLAGEEIEELKERALSL